MTSNQTQILFVEGVRKLRQVIVVKKIGIVDDYLSKLLQTKASVILIQLLHKRIISLRYVRG